MELLAGALGVATLVCFGLLKWRWAVWGALLLVVFEGALRKWVMPGRQAEIFFLKDFLLLGAYWTYFLRLRVGRGLKPFRHHMANGLLAAITALCVVQVANPRASSLLLGVLGLQNYLFYVPLMYMVPDLLRDRAELSRFVYGTFTLAFVPLLLGPVQFVLPPSHPLNQYARDVDYLGTIATFGESRARVTATFPYITGYGVYLDLMFLLAFALILSGPRGWFRKVLYAVLGLTVANLLMTGSRAPVLYAALCVPVMLLLAGSSMKRRDLRVVVLTMFLLPVLLLGVVKIFPDALAAFINRVETSHDAGARLRWFVDNPVWAAQQAGLKGWGTGATSNGAAYLPFRGESYDPAPGAEGEWERIILEIGATGLPLILLVRALVCLQLWKAYRRTQQAALRPLLLAGLAFTAICFPGNLVMHHAASMLYYFCAGLAFLGLPLARRQPQKAVPVQLRQSLVVTG